MLIAQFVKLLFLPIALASLSVPTGLINSGSTCFLNSLVSCLYDLPKFREIIYRHFDSNPVVTALAGVFARKQLNNLHALDIRHDMIRAVDAATTVIRIGEYNDIDELFRDMFVHFPEELADSIGIRYTQQLRNPADGYLISEAEEKREPFLIIQLPDHTKSHNLLQLIHANLFYTDSIDFKLYPEEHLNYFLLRGMPFEELQIQALSSKRITHFSDILPVFISRARRTDKALRDEVVIDEFLQLEGAPEYILISFAVFHASHYYSYVRSSTDLQWYRHNDSSVAHVSFKDMEKDLAKRTVLLFYVRAQRIDDPEIPNFLRFYAEEANKLQHMKQFNK